MFYVPLEDSFQVQTINLTKWTLFISKYSCLFQFQSYVLVYTGLIISALTAPNNNTASELHCLVTCISRSHWTSRLRPLACWVCGFESCKGHECLSRKCCVLSGRGLCYGPIPRPEEWYRLWRVTVCDLESHKWGGYGPRWAVFPEEKNTSIKRAQLPSWRFV